MSTIHSPELGPYRRGDLASLPQNEPDPIPKWAEHAEQYSHDLRSIRIDGKLVACIGYMPETMTRSAAFAVLDRDACVGYGKEISRIVREQNLAWMEHIGCTEAVANCPAHDRQARVFLRAVGYRQVPNPDIENYHFKLTRSTQHG